jgi:hypothetical protein
MPAEEDLGEEEEEDDDDDDDDDEDEDEDEGGGGILGAYWRQQVKARAEHSAASKTATCEVEEGKEVPAATHARRSPHRTEKNKINNPLTGEEGKDEDEDEEKEEEGNKEGDRGVRGLGRRGSGEEMSKETSSSSSSRMQGWGSDGEGGFLCQRHSSRYSSY